MSHRERTPNTTSHENKEWASSTANEDADHTRSESAFRRLVQYSDSEDEESCESAGELASREPRVQDALCGSSTQDASDECAVQNGPLPSSAYDSDSLFIPMEENAKSTEDALEGDERPFSPFDDDKCLLFVDDECPSEIERLSGVERHSSSKRSSDSGHKHASKIKHIPKNTRTSAHNSAHAPKGACLVKLASTKTRAPAIEPGSASAAKRASANKRAPTAEPESARATKRAREVKARVKKSLTMMKPSSRASKVLVDPENHAIKRMRQEENMEFTAIAQQLNKERLERGEPQIMTAASVYSRFVRNCPRIAAAQGETGFDTRDYMYLRNPQKHPAAELPGAVNNSSGFSFGGNGARKRPSDAERAEKELANNVRHMAAETLSEQKDIVAQPEMTEALMEAVAGVNDCFWDHVASTMEAKTGKLFDKNVLESRYNTFKW